MVALHEVKIHLIAIEVSVVSTAVGIVHADSLLFGQDASDMGHDTRLVEGRLAID